MTSFRSFGAWSLKSKFALCGGALMFAFATAFTTWTLRQVEADVRADVTEAQRSLLRSIAADLDEKLEFRRDALIAAAGRIGPLQPEPAGEFDRFFEERPVLTRLFDALRMADGSGRTIYAWPPGSVDTEATPAYQDALQRLRDGATLVITRPQRPLPGASPLVRFAAPARDAGGRLTGVLFGSVNLERSNFLAALGRKRIGHEGYFAIVGATADAPVFVVHGQPERTMTAAPTGTVSALLARASPGEIGTETGTSVQGVETLRTFTRLRSAPWMLVAVYPTAEAFAGLIERQRAVLWVGAGLFCGASLIFWLLSGWLLRPLGRLHDELTQRARAEAPPLVPREFGSAELADLVAAYNVQAARRTDVEERLKASEQRIQGITDNMPALVAYIDRDRVYRFANARYSDWLGLDPELMVGRHVREVLTPPQYAAKAPRLRQALAGQRVRWDAKSTRRGESFDLLVEYIPDTGPDGVVKGCYALGIDITALKQAQARQARVEEQLRAITDNLPVLISYIDRDERYVFANATFQAWLGLDPATLVGRRVADVMAPLDYEARRGHIQRCLRGERVAFDIGSDTLAAGRDLQTVYIPDRGEDGTIAGFYTLSTDVTDVVRAQRQLAALVRRDSLTGLANRYLFNETLPQALARSERSGLALALMFLDIDHFKQINDIHGHAAGDRVLQLFADRLQRSVRTTDLVARLGGDEFVVILESLHDDGEPQAVAQKILAGMLQPFDIDGEPVNVTTSVGIAFQASPRAGAFDVVAQADAALYKAKAAGRNKFRLA